MNRRALAGAAAAVVALAACSSATAHRTTSTPPPVAQDRTSAATTTIAIAPATSADDDGPVSTSTSNVAAGSASVPVDPDAPLPATALTAAPSVLGSMFTTRDDPLPAQTTAALHDAGGEALGVNEALTSFGVFGIPRPSGVNSAVMELDVTASALAATNGTSLTAEVVYMVSSTTPIDELLADAATTISGAGSTPPPSTVADYDGTTGDPRCARLPLPTSGMTVLSVEGCEYRGDPLTGVRSIGFRRLNLPVTGPIVLPPVFHDVPAALLAAGAPVSYTANFGRPTGPSGNTIQLKLRVQLNAELTGLGDGWQADGPGRWWNANATVTVDAGIATWESSSRATT